MTYLDLQKDGGVYILKLINGAKANTFNEEVIAEYNQVLDKLESSEGNAALVITSTDPKFWSNGIDLEWIITKSPDYFPLFGNILDKLFLRFALLNMPTIGCITGHCYAAAAILASTLDFRLMRLDRGFFCFPEVDIKIPFTKAMQEVIKMLSDQPTMREMILTGRRIGGEEALKMKIVAAVYPEDTLFPKALEMGKFLSQKDRQTYTKLKRDMRRNLVDMQQNLSKP